MLAQVTMIAANLYHFIISHATAAKVGVVMVVAALAGEADAVINGANAHPALISGLVGGIVALLIKLIDKQIETRKRTVASADKVLEIETAEKREIREEARRLRREAQQLGDEKLLLSKAETFEARARAHRLGSEVMRLQNIVLGLQNTMAGAQPPIPIPQITFTEYSVLMFGTDEQQKELQEQISRLQEQMRRDEDGDTLSSDNLHTTKPTT
jgi:hypothetical protein